MDQAELIVYLSEKGLLVGDGAHLTPLAGGISSDIMLVEEGSTKFVLKRSLEKLRVEDDWHCSTARNITEYEAIRYASKLFPESVPRVLHADPDQRLFVMEYFDDEYSPWKGQLLAGLIDLNVGRKIGEMLAKLHSASWLSTDARQRFGTDDHFFSLRVEPYLLTTGKRHPNLRSLFQDEAERIQRTSLALVHGDWSAKNFLVSRNRVVILDWEAAWFGDPAFDAAFFLNLVYLKSLHNRRQVDEYLELIREFRSAYGERVYKLDAQLEQRIVKLTLMLMLARIDGKSKVEYITSSTDKDVVRSFTRESLLDGIDNWNDVDLRWQKATDTR
jgi:5-methylthioribose kinase